MKKTNLIVLTTLGLLFIGCGGGTTTSEGEISSGGETSSPTDVTVVDGYIKDATVYDSAGLTAIYSGANGKYTFIDTPTYPITVNGGKLEDTNLDFDIEMKSDSTVISPITTFLHNDDEVLEKFKLMNLGAITASQFSVDYIESNDTTLAKVSQVLYTMLKDDSQAIEFKKQVLSGEITSLDLFFAKASESIEASFDTIEKKQEYRNLLKSIKAFDQSPAEFEEEIKFVKNAVAYDPLTAGYYKARPFEVQYLSKIYIRDNTNSTVEGIASDTEASKLWQDGIDQNTITRSHIGAVDYCKNFITESGYSSWRLPSVGELSDIVDKNTSNQITPAIEGFEYVAKARYWTSDPKIVIDFKYRDDYAETNSSSLYYVRCISDKN